jgi:hypothetical protein
LKRPVFGVFEAGRTDSGRLSGTSAAGELNVSSWRENAAGARDGWSMCMNETRRAWVCDGRSENALVFEGRR